MLVIVVLVTLGLLIRWWPLEFIVSYTPQLLVLLWVYLMVYAVLATWYMFVNGAKIYKERVGIFSTATLFVAIFVGVYALAHSLNAVAALDIQDELSLSSERLTVGTFNKLYKSTNFVEDSNLITASRIDVFSLQEVKEAEIKLLSDRVNHPYTYLTDCDCSADDTEVGLISRYPIINAQTIYEHENAVIARTLISSEEHGDFVVYLVHMHVPYESSSYNLRKRAFKTLTDAANNETLPTFAVGDFNTTVFSPDMQNFSSNADTMINVVSRSWPRCSWFGTKLGELACARIDYVFAPVESNIYSMEIGEQDFSDHRSVIVEVSL